MFKLVLFIKRQVRILQEGFRFLFVRLEELCLEFILRASLYILNDEAIKEKCFSHVHVYLPFPLLCSHVCVCSVYKI